MGPDPRDTPTTSQPPTVSIVIVTYGTGPVVVDCLDAVAAHTGPSHEVIIVDNWDGDTPSPTAALLADSGRLGTGGVELVQPGANLGFAGGNNAGARRARGRFLCFLNPDVIVGPGWIEPLLAALEDPVVGIAAPVLVNTDGSLQEAGQLLYADACTAAVGGPEVLAGDWSQAFTRDIDYASAACWVMRRTDVDELGGFDERFHPAYFEDVDLALRVEARGQRTRLVAGTPLVHLHGEGGEGGGLAIGEASQVVFRSIWSDRIADRPRRPTDEAAAIVNRDRLATGVTGWTVTGGDPATQRRALELATGFARSHPRQRVSVLADTLTIDAAEIAAARACGVEVVAVGDHLDAARAARAHPEARWGHLGEPPAPGLREAARLVWSPLTLVVGIVGVLLRVLVVRSPAGGLNADEAYTGLAAMGVLDGRFPVVIDGNVYSATLEAYLLAPFTAAIGPSALLLKTMPMVFWAVAALLAAIAGNYLTADVGGTGRPVGRRVGAVAGSLVWLAPGALLVLSTTAYLGYALGMALCVAVLIAAAVLVDRGRPAVRWSLAFGALVGLALYVHPMFVTVLLPLAVPVAWMHRRAVRDFWVPATAAALAVLTPFLLWNAVNGFPSLDVPPPMNSTTYTGRVRSFFEVLLPRGLGLRDPAGEWVLGRPWALVAYAVLFAVVVCGAVGLVARGRRPSRVLVPAVVVVVWPLMAVFSSLGFVADGRYSIIAFPFLALAAASTLVLVPVSGRALIGVAVAAVAVWIAVFVWPHTWRVTDRGRVVDADAPTIEVVDYLRSEGIERIAGDYWRVLPIEYFSDLEIRGAVTQPATVIRFPDRQREVQAESADDVAFVFQRGATPVGLWLPAERYRIVTVGETDIYLPQAAG